MDHYVAIVKDFTRARTPDILEVLKNGAPGTGVVFAGLRCRAQVTPLTHDQTHSIQGYPPSDMTPGSPPHDLDVQPPGKMSRNEPRVRVAARSGRFRFRAMSAM